MGAGGHARSCIEAIETNPAFEITGLIDNDSSITEVLGYPVIGDDSLLAGLAISSNDTFFLITVGQLKTSAVRSALYYKITAAGGKFTVVFSGSASISRRSTIGEGTMIMQQAIVNANAMIGRNTIINNKALIEHDAVIGDHCHISTGGIVNGSCKIGDRVFIGSGAVLVNNISIADDIVIGAGSTVVSSITEAGIYAGNPARKIS